MARALEGDATQGKKKDSKRRATIGQCFLDLAENWLIRVSKGGVLRGGEISIVGVVRAPVAKN